jgi:pimeloyl-ACP methyl ester carboxylesterase
VDITEGRIDIDGMGFAYLEAGSGPLALCLHGFPDSAWTWRHLLPRLAADGYRAVAPFLRGYAPTDVPDDGLYQPGAIARDANALHAALGGEDDAVLIGHDWGALATYVAAAAAPERWRRVVAAAVPPQAAIAEAFFSYDQLQRSWYMFFFQSPLADMAVPIDDLAFIDRLWADWSPGYEATEDLAHVKDCLRDPANLTAALGYYRATIGSGARSPELDALEASAAAGPPPQPTLYLHGVDDGCMGIDLADRAASLLTSNGSRMARVDGTGHFLHLEAPDRVNDLIADFLAA